MTTADDIRHNQPVSGTLRFTINKVDHSPTPPRDVELTATDSDGNQFQIVLWEKHDVNGDWVINEKYALTGGRGKRYSNTSPEVVIDSNKALEIERLDSEPSATELLIVGDTHIGYRYRNRSEKRPWARSVDARDGFKQALEVAISRDVDAIVHAGDVFDHKATRSDCIGVTADLMVPLGADIPIYYIRGNHDTDYGIESLQHFADGAEMRLRLGTEPITLGDPSVNLFGIDYTAGDLPKGGLESTVSTFFDRNILVLHEKPYPVTNDQGSLIYNTGADVSAFLELVSVDIDLVVTGHMHVGKQGRVVGHDVPVVVTGPTSTISKYKKDNKPSVWLTRITEDDLTIERLELRS